MGQCGAVVLVRVVRIVQLALDLVQPVVQLLDGPAQGGDASATVRVASRFITVTPFRSLIVVLAQPRARARGPVRPEAEIPVTVTRRWSK